MRTKLVLVIFAGALVVYLVTRESGSPPLNAVPETTPRVQAADRRVHSPALPHATSAKSTSDIDRQIDEKLAADPIARAIPMLYDLAKEKQLESLYWIKYLPKAKLLELCPRLGDGTEMSVAERERQALEMVDGFIRDLEREGIKAPRFH